MKKNRVASELAYIFGVKQIVKSHKTSNSNNNPQFNGAALVKTSSDNKYGLVLNCKIFSENYKFTATIMQSLVFVSDKKVALKIEGTSVNWYSNDLTNFNGAQYIIKQKDIDILKNDVKYLIYIMFIINNKIYMQPLNPNGISIPDGFNIESSIINNQLVIIKNNKK